MNKYQKAYTIALIMAASARQKYNTIEREYITAQGIKNSNGEQPEHLYDIEDYDTFNHAMESIEDSLNAINVQKYEIRLKRAEDRLIDFALSVFPECYGAERDKMRAMAIEYKNFKVRQKIIKYALSLDPVLAETV